MEEIKIIKASGQESIFDISKLIGSLKRAGASPQMANRIADEIASTLEDGMSTKEIYQQAFTKLKKHSRPTAARYKLKKAIMELGTSGYPFEQYIAALLQEQGFQTIVGAYMEGHCVTHEIDVIAKKDLVHYICECKFHNRQDRNCSIKVPLYIHSRFNDVKKALKEKVRYKGMRHQGWIFTNTRFTSDALKYGKCVGLHLVGWDYPHGQGIKDLTDRAGIHPITCLTSLASKEKSALLEHEIVHVRDLHEQPDMLLTIGVSPNRQKKIFNEVEELCAV